MTRLNLKKSLRWSVQFDGLEKVGGGLAEMRKRARMVGLTFAWGG